MTGYLLFVFASNSPSSRPCIVNVIFDNAGQVHHFNPGGGVPAWLINRLAEGKPLAFVQRLEKVAAQWDGQTRTTKGLLSDGAGFGEHGIGSIGLARRAVGWELLRCSILMTGFSLGFAGWNERRGVLSYCSAVYHYSAIDRYGAVHHCSASTVRHRGDFWVQNILVHSS